MLSRCRELARFFGEAAALPFSHRLPKVVFHVVYTYSSVPLLRQVAQVAIEVAG